MKLHTTTYQAINMPYPENRSPNKPAIPNTKHMIKEKWTENLQNKRANLPKSWGCVNNTTCTYTL